jgi:hypothetical protein
MGKRYEVRLQITNEKYTDQLIIALVRQGYEVYLSHDEEVCFGTCEDELTQIKEGV